MKQLAGIVSPLIEQSLSIAAIPTQWNGVTYRSRLEARWAAFLEIAGINAEYESNGYDLHGTWYLPDFFVSDWNLFIEVKPIDPSQEELRKAGLLESVTGCRCLIVVGEPRRARGWLVMPPLVEVGEPPTAQAQLSRCRECNRIGISYRTAGSSGEIDLEPCRADECTERWAWFGNGFEEIAQRVADIKFGTR